MKDSDFAAFIAYAKRELQINHTQKIANHYIGFVALAHIARLRKVNLSILLADTIESNFHI